MAEGQNGRVPADPLESPMWDSMVANYLKDHPIVFDDGTNNLGQTNRPRQGTRPLPLGHARAWP